MRQLLRHVVLGLVLTAGLLPAAHAAPVPALDDTWTPEAVEAPQDGVLSAAYPNPFNPTTSFTLTVDEAQTVKIEVFNVLGQRVRVLFEGDLEPHIAHRFAFEAGDLPTGIYLYRAEGRTFNATRRVTLLR